MRPARCFFLGMLFPATYTIRESGDLSDPSSACTILAGARSSYSSFGGTKSAMNNCESPLRVEVHMIFFPSRLNTGNTSAPG